MKVGLTLVLGARMFVWPERSQAPPSGAPIGEHVPQSLPSTVAPSRHRKEEAMDTNDPVSVLYPCCCGLDIHKREVQACVLITLPGGKVRQEQRTYSTVLSHKRVGRIR